MKKKIKIGLIGIVSLVIVIGAAWSINKALTYGKPAVKYMHAQWAFDGDNTPGLVWWADNVFVGKVEKQVGSKLRDKLPITEFEVEVLENIKGNLKKKTIVGQEAGYVNGTLILFENDKIIEPGKTYMFVTKYSQSGKYNLLAPIWGDIEITSDTHHKGLKEKFVKAYKEEKKPEEYK